MSRRAGNVLSIVMVMASTIGIERAIAAELRIELGELARIVTAFSAGATVHLNYAPPAGLPAATGSYLTFAGRTVALPVPARSTLRAGARYAYDLSNVTSTEITAEPGPGVIRLHIAFEDEGAELIGRCVSAPCPPAGALPVIEWVRPSISLDLAPVQLAERISLEVRNVAVGGVFEPRCRDSVGVVAQLLCHVGLMQANAELVRLKGTLDQSLQDGLNTPEIQARLADAWAGFLALGPGHGVRVRSLMVGAGAATVSFCVAC